MTNRAIFLCPSKQTQLKLTAHSNTLVSDLTSLVFRMFGITDGRYFGLFKSPDPQKNDIYLDRSKQLDKQIDDKTDHLYLRICVFTKNPHEIEDTRARTLYAHLMKNVLDLNKNFIDPTEFSILESSFFHMIGDDDKIEDSYLEEMGKLSVSVTLISFLIRISQLPFYMAGVLSYDCSDKFTKLSAVVTINPIGVAFTREEKILFVVKWKRFSKISWKENVVKMQIKGEPSKNVPSQVFSIEFQNPAFCRSFMGLCTENHKFSTTSTIHEKPQTLDDFEIFSSYFEEMGAKYVTIPYRNNSYNFSISGGCHEMLIYVEESEILDKLKRGDIILFINGRCTFSLSLQDMQNILTCNSFIRSELNLVVISDFISLQDGSPKFVETPWNVTYNFTRLVNLNLRGTPFATKLRANLPKVDDSLSASDEVQPCSNEAICTSMDQLRNDIENGRIRNQYINVPKVWPGTTMNVANSSLFRKLNRYRDTVPYDQTLVTIRGGNGYINASLVEYYKNNIKLNFIAAQGPLESTVADFYHMIWDRRATFIVMLTGLVEKNVPKCHRYWPNIGKTVIFGPFSITNLKEEVKDDYVITNLVIANSNSPRDENLKVKHFRYTGWPDHGVPNEMKNFYNFVVHLYDILYGDQPTPTPIIHCSAGVGRTGVIISSLILLYTSKRRQTIVPEEILSILRKSRTLMVQTIEQYEFVCKIALHIAAINIQPQILTN